MDIRDVRWTQGKSYRKYTYTIQDIARLRGVTIGAVRQAIRRGTVKLGSMDSVMLYCYPCYIAKSEPTLSPSVAREEEKKDSLHALNPDNPILLFNALNVPEPILGG